MSSMLPFVTRLCCTIGIVCGLPVGSELLEDGVLPSGDPLSIILNALFRPHPYSVLMDVFTRPVPSNAESEKGSCQMPVSPCTLQCAPIRFKYTCHMTVEVCTNTCDRKILISSMQIVLT